MHVKAGVVIVAVLMIGCAKEPPPAPDLREVFDAAFDRAAVAKPVAPDTFDWTTAGNVWSGDNINIKIHRAWVGPQEVTAGDKTQRVNDEPKLHLVIEVHNQTENRKLTLFGDLAERPRVTDEFGNEYGGVPWGIDGVTVGGEQLIGQSEIYPGKSVRGVMMLEPPVEAAKE